MTTPRGVRNNNPGSIDYNPHNAWQGQLGLEIGVAKLRFARFDHPENGIRSLAKLLFSYRGQKGDARCWPARYRHPAGVHCKRSMNPPSQRWEAL